MVNEQFEMTNISLFLKIVFFFRKKQIERL